MSAKLADKLNIDMDPPYLGGRACATCKHYQHSRLADFNRCGFYGTYLSSAQHPQLCGAEHKYWEPVPPSLGFFGHLKKMLWGSK